jgi:hypothetical protein
MRDEVRRRRQGIFREVNACIADAPGRRDGATEFLCECGDGKCTRTLSATSDEIEALHGRPSHLIVAARHAALPGWRVVDANERYAVLEREREPLPRLHFATARQSASRARI